MEFRLVRSKRKTLCLCVEKDGGILVRAPLKTGEAEIADFVKRHERWILSRIQRYGNCKRLTLLDGERLVLFGREYELATGRAAVCSNKIFLPAKGRGEALVRLLKALTLEYMTALTEEIAAKHQFSYGGVRVSSAKTRWGSCNRKGVVTYTFYLAFAEPSLCRYVAVHELCHTRIFNHSKLFWKEVSSVLPDWHEMRLRLRRQEEVFGYLDGVLS